MKKLKKNTTDKLREDILEEILQLKNKALKHVSEASEALEPCLSCSINKVNNIHIPGKYKDESGKCGFCHGTGAKPNERQRNWATEEILGRLAPKAKPIEMTQKDAPDTEDFEKEIEKELDNGVTLNELLTKYGIKTESNKGNSTKES